MVKCYCVRTEVRLMSTTLNLGGMQSISTMTGTIDYSQIIEQLTAANRAPGDALNSVIQTEQLKQNDWSNIANMAGTLQNALVTLGTSGTYNAFTTTIGGTNPTAISAATASTSATAGTYNINVVQTGSNASIKSGAEIGKAATLSDLVSSNEFVSGMSLGTVSVTIGSGSSATTVSHTLTSTDTIGQVLTDLLGSSASASMVTSPNYPGSTLNNLQITNNGTQQITFGSAGDSSNFFQLMGLSGQTLAGTSGATVTGSLVGHAQSTGYLQSANLATAFSMPVGTTAGTVAINGVNINYDISKDTLQSLISRINTSTAGVTASYDPIQDKMVLASNTSQPVSVQDVTGNLGAVLGLTTASNPVTTAGQAWQYQINGGTTQTSDSATVTSAIPGVSFTISPTAVAGNTATVTVAQDTSTMTKAVNTFVAAFNSLYSQLNTYTGKGGDLQGDVAMAQLGFQYMNDVLDNLPGVTQYTQQSVWGIGITNGAIGSAPGTTNSLQLDSNALTTAFQNNPSEVQSLLTGMATRLNTDLTSLTGQYNSLTPNSLYSQNISGTAQNEQNLYAGMITDTEKQQQQIYDQATAEAQQMQQQFNQLQQYQEQMAVQARALSSLLGTTTTY